MSAFQYPSQASVALSSQPGASTALPQALESALPSSSVPASCSQYWPPKQASTSSWSLASSSTPQPPMTSNDPIPPASLTHPLLHLCVTNLILKHYWLSPSPSSCLLLLHFAPSSDLPCFFTRPRLSSYSLNQLFACPFAPLF